MVLYQLLEKVILVRRSRNINIDLTFPGCLKTALKAQSFVPSPSRKTVFKGNKNYDPHIMYRGGYEMSFYSEATFVCPAAGPG